MAKKLFVKGQSGNPYGRPPMVESYKRVIQQGLIQVLQDRTMNKGQEQTKFDAFLSNFMEKAIIGEPRAQEVMAKLLFSENTLEDYDNWLNRGREDDVDFRLFKIMKRAFDIQQRIILSKQNRIYVMAGRRSGKTWMNIFKLLYTMIDLAHDTATRSIREKPVRVVYCGLTIQKSIDLIYDQFLAICQRLLIPVAKERRNEGFIELANGSQLFIAGDASSAEQEKARGPYLDLLILDEIQSHPDARLRYFIESIIEPELIDTKGTLMMTGTGPRTRGMLWSQIWENYEDKWPGLRINWNVYDNPFIEDHEAVLQQVLKDHGWTANSNAFIREYLGKISYDEEALVWRLTQDNYFTKTDLINWINSQSITDIRFTSGLDYGFVSADAFVMVVWSISNPYKYVISEYKKSRTGWSELIEAVKAKILEVRNDPTFDRKELVAPNDPGWELSSTLNSSQMQYVKPTLVTISKDFAVWAEWSTGGQKTSIDFRKEGIPVVDAHKHNKEQAVELLREEVNTRHLKVMAPEYKDGKFIRHNSIFAEEALYTVFSRDEQDNLTRQIDDAVYHPDLADALIYSFFPIWVSEKKLTNDKAMPQV